MKKLLLPPCNDCFLCLLFYSQRSRGTYREQHDGDSQSDGGENGQTHQQQHGVKLINLGEGVEQLCLYVVCVRGQTMEKNMNNM